MSPGKAGWDGQVDELGLTAGAVRRNHHAPGDGIGHLGAVVQSDEVETQVDAGGGPGGGPDAAFAHVEHVGPHVDGGVGGGQFRGPHPVGGGGSSVEQPGGGEHEGARAERRHTGTAFGCGAQRDQRRFGWPPGDTGLPPGDDHQIGVGRVGDGPRRLQREPGGRHERAIGSGDDAHVEARDALCGPVDTEHFARDREFEDGHAAKASTAIRSMAET